MRARQLLLAIKQAVATTLNSEYRGTIFGLIALCSLTIGGLASFLVWADSLDDPYDGPLIYDMSSPYVEDAVLSLSEQVANTDGVIVTPGGCLPNTEDR